MDPDAVVVLVGVWSRGSIADSMGYLGAQGLPLLLLVGGFAGFLSCQASQLAVVKAVAALLCKVVGMAKRSAERRVKDLDQFPGSLRRAPGLDQRSTGRGPGRRAYQRWPLLLWLVPKHSCVEGPSGLQVHGRGRSRRRSLVTGIYGVFGLQRVWGPSCNFPFVGALCAIWVGQLSSISLYSVSVVYWSLYVFLNF